MPQTGLAIMLTPFQLAGVWWVLELRTESLSLKCRWDTDLLILNNHLYPAYCTYKLGTNKYFFPIGNTIRVSNILGQTKVSDMLFVLVRIG